MTDRIAEIYALYDAYIEKTEELNRNKKFYEGLLGLTKGPESDPCHDRFVDDLEELINAFAAEDPSSEDVYTLLRYMYTIPFQYRDDKMLYWMFLAVHSLALVLIPHLNSRDAQLLYQQYDSDYPRSERLPAQKKTLKQLKAAF